MSIYDFSDELREGYLSGEKNKLLKQLIKAIKDANMKYNELIDFGVSQEIDGVMRLFIDYGINRGGVTPKDETIAGIMGIQRAFDLSDSDDYADDKKKIDKWRKVLSVFRSYGAVDRKLYFMMLSGAQIEQSWDRLLIDGVDYVNIY